MRDNFLFSWFHTFVYHSFMDRVLSIKNITIVVLDLKNNNHNTDCCTLLVNHTLALTAFWHI